MTDKPKVYIAGIGMITPVGANTEMTAAAVRAGVSGYRESDFFDQDYNKIRIASIPEAALENALDVEKLSSAMSGRQARMLQMATVAMREITSMLPKREAVPLFLAGPEPLDAADATLGVSFIKNLAAQTGVDLDLPACRINALGRAGGPSSVKLAFRYFESTDAKFALVGGVDSFYDKDLLSCLSAANRLLSGDAMDGFIPGEGAAFLLLARQPLAATTPFIFEPGDGTEKGHRHSDQPYTGDGLATAATAAIDNADVEKIYTLYSSMNGESFFAKEHGVAMIRNSDVIDASAKIEHPADCYGDIGAAAGIVMLGMIAQQVQTGKVRPPCLVCCSSDREYRSAVVVGARRL